MKQLLLLLLLGFLLLQNSEAQKPEPIYSFARVQMPLTWYKEQAQAWKNEVDKNPKNANAWYNYYRVNRNLLYHDTTDKRSREDRDKSIYQLVDKMGKQIPNTYEYNLCKWMAGGNDFSLLPYLKKADELGQGRYEYLDNMINWGEIERNIAKRDLYCKKWFDLGQVSAGMLYYNFNVLKGTPPNAILVTCGDNDTYPIWILQSQGIRRDVTVINTSLIHIDDYRTKIFKELGIEETLSEKDQNGTLSQDSYTQFNHALIKCLAGNKKNYPVQVALTTTGHNVFTEKIQENLYLTGLSYSYSPEPLDNVALLKRNFEQVYTLDYLENAFYTEISVDRVKEINRNYMVPMLKLFDHYKAAGDASHETWISQKLKAVSKGTEDETEIKKHID